MPLYSKGVALTYRGKWEEKSQETGEIKFIRADKPKFLRFHLPVKLITGIYSQPPAFMSYVKKIYFFHPIHSPILTPTILCDLVFPSFLSSKPVQIAVIPLVTVQSKNNYLNAHFPQ